VSAPSAADYIAAGFALVPIPYGSKAPKGNGWQLEENAVRTIEQAERLNGGNVGIAHRWSGTCALDADDYAKALDWLAARGIYLDALLAAEDAVQICSGRENRCKLLFRTPDGVVWLPTLQIGAGGLELRCATRDGSSTVMDILPPSVHPATGQPYAWAGLGDWRNPPELPAELLALWRELASNGARVAPGGSEGGPVPEGGRNAFLTSLAGSMRRRGMSEAGIYAALMAENAERCVPPLSQADVARIAKAVSRYAPGAAREEPPIGEEPPYSGGNRKDATDSAINTGTEWPPPIDSCAYCGLAGEIVQAIGPHTERDPAALLVQILVAFGVLVGRTAYYPVEGDRHYSNLYLLLNGGTSKGRKGTSWGRVHSIFGRVPQWPRVVSGLSSGEGLKWQVRDPGTKTVKGEEVTDEGVHDKRLLVLEPEFGSVLRVVARKGNTLSATVRSGWDTGYLSALTKHDHITATGTHISIIGHITVDELRAELTQTDTANGFANRFLFLCVRRSKCLPRGGEGFT
jgi:Bifunctional DNA primase/polymerase, N-terminal/Primase C terminal 1 (PriCT-1)